MLILDHQHEVEVLTATLRFLHVLQAFDRPGTPTIFLSYEVKRITPHCSDLADRKKKQKKMRETRA